jgi:toxin ParE1/3/4
MRDRAVILRAEAEADLAEAVAWYNARRTGLGADLLLAVEALLEDIGRRGESFPLVHQDVRRALLKRFPYSMFFVVGDAVISVIAVFHARRDPKIWQDRASG